MDWREGDGVRWLEAALPGARAAFSTRLGGASCGPFASLNLGRLTGDAIPAVAENRRRLAAALGRGPDGFLLGHQVHGTGIAARDAPPDPNPYGDPGLQADEADGQVTAIPALTPLVQVADCLPVALSGPRGVAMLHCGWRGLAEGIVAAGVEAVGAGAAAIGPGIGRCCYAVGPEVSRRFADLAPDVAAGRRLDLAAVTRELLARAGVARVETAELCTSCEPELFFSHRRDGGRTGRQGGAVWRVVDG